MWVEFGSNPAAEADFVIEPGSSEPMPCRIYLTESEETVPVVETEVGKQLEIRFEDPSNETKDMRFSSDEFQDGNPTGEWTDWYSWNVSSDNWDASTKTEDWVFATVGAKEIWAEVRDQAGQSTKCYASIYANLANEASKQFGVGE